MQDGPKWEDKTTRANCPLPCILYHDFCAKCTKGGCERLPDQNGTVWCPLGTVNAWVTNCNHTKALALSHPLPCPFSEAQPHSLHPLPSLSLDWGADPGLRPRGLECGIEIWGGAWSWSWSKHRLTWAPLTPLCNPSTAELKQAPCLPWLCVTPRSSQHIPVALEALICCGSWPMRAVESAVRVGAA